MFTLYIGISKHFHVHLRSSSDASCFLYRTYTPYPTEPLFLGSRLKDLDIKPMANAVRCGRHTRQARTDNGNPRTAEFGSAFGRRRRSGREYPVKDLLESDVEAHEGVPQEEHQIGFGHCRVQGRQNLLEGFSCEAILQENGADSQD